MRGLALLPPIGLLRRIGVHAVPRPDGSAWDHWTYRAQPQLMLDGGSKTRADVAGTQVEVHVGHMGQVIGIRARWSPLSGEQQFTDLSPLPTAAGAPGSFSGAAGTSGPEVKYMHDGDGIPQFYLAPYWFVASGDGDVDVVSASPYSLTVGVDLTRQGPSGMRLTALASGGSGRYVYNWGAYTLAGIEAGIRTIGPGTQVTVDKGKTRATASTISLPIGAYIVLLNVKDSATGAFKHHQQQVFRLAVRRRRRRNIGAAGGVVAMLCVDAATGWSFECLTEPSGLPLDGGLVLQKVRHDGHNFARDIRTIGVWFELERFDGLGRALSRTKAFCPLLASKGFAVSKVRQLVPETVQYPETLRKIPGHAQTFKYLAEANTALLFSDYFRDGDNAVARGVAATYDGQLVIDTLVFGCGYPPCEYSGFTVEQLFLFSRYANDPAHEPSGALHAARFHPLITYRLTKNTAYDPKLSHTKIASIRFDYRLQLYLDSSYEWTEKPDAAQVRRRRSQGNQAGLFADKNSVGIRDALGQLFSGDFENATFTAVEKPLVIEATAPGLLKGVSDGSELAIPPPEGKVDCWDNVHWWGTRYLPPDYRYHPSAPVQLDPDPYISAPGAFHAAHCHWRWGAAIAATAILPGIDYDYGFRHFLPGRPLVDPGIFMQTIRVAVSKNDPRLDPARTAFDKLTASEWEELFEKQNTPPPQPIDTGDDIVFWYSAEVSSEVTIPGQSKTPFWAADGGTVFLHGIFFAHDAEQHGLLVGSTNARYWPRSAAKIRQDKKWFRPAS